MDKLLDKLNGLITQIKGLSFNQKVVTILAIAALIIPTMSYFGDRGLLEITITKRFGDIYNYDTQEKTQGNIVNVRFTNVGKRDIMVLDAGCYVHSNKIMFIEASNRKLLPSESMFHSLDENGDKLIYCEARDSQGNTHRKWNTSLRNRVCDLWNTITQFGREETIVTKKGNFNLTVVVRKTNSFYCSYN